jgi:hypothetical protein
MEMLKLPKCIVSHAMAPTDLALEDVRRAETKSVDPYGRFSVGTHHSAKLVTIYELENGRVIAEVEADPDAEPDK